LKPKGIRMYSCVGRELSLTELLRRQDHYYTVNMPREKHAGNKTRPGLLKF